MSVIGETYAKIGDGREYADVPPISGNYHGTRERTITVVVKITPVIQNRPPTAALSDCPPTPFIKGGLLPMD